MAYLVLSDTGDDCDQKETDSHAYASCRRRHCMTLLSGRGTFLCKVNEGLDVVSYLLRTDIVLHTLDTNGPMS